MKRANKVIWVIQLGVAVAALSLTGAAHGAYAQGARPSAQEQAAIDVVKRWFAAWQQGDADKMASLMSENVEFRGIPNQPIRMGREAFKQNTGRFIALKPHIRVTQAWAVGGATGVAVLTRRVDRVNLNGQERTVPLAAFFRVHDGKIEEWLDMPLVALGGPPAGRSTGATGRGPGTRD